MILRSSSKQFRFGKVEIFAILKDRFVLCGSKIVERLIAPELLTVLFLPRVTH